MPFRSASSWILGLSCVLVGCTSSGAGIPDSIEPKIDKTVVFSDLVASPESYKGRTVLLGDQVLRAKRLKEGTQVEVLQLPLNDDQEPTTDVT
jgi:outer membrane lipoprotein